MTFDADDKGVSELDIFLIAESEADRDKIVNALTTGWGPITTKKKSEDDDTEEQRISVDGLSGLVNPENTNVSLTITKGS